MVHVVLGGWCVGLSRVRTLAGTLCSETKRLTPTVPLSTQVGTSKLIWKQADKMLGDGLVSYLGAEMHLVASYYAEKREISTGSDELSGSPNYDWGRLYLPTL